MYFIRNIIFVFFHLKKWIWLFVIIDLCILEWSSSLFMKVIDFHIKLKWRSWENFTMLHAEQWHIHILYCLNHLSFIWLQRYKHLLLSVYIIYSLNYTFICVKIQCHLLLNTKITYILPYSALFRHFNNNLLGVDLLLINIRIWSTTSFNQGPINVIKHNFNF